MAGNFRKDRVAELVRQVISDIVRFDLKDPRTEGVTITEVRMSGDLKSAKIYFAALADGMSQTHQEGLIAAGGFIRRRLREEVDLKYIPELSFFYDTAFDNYDRIDRILKEIQGADNDNDT